MSKRQDDGIAYGIVEGLNTALVLLNGAADIEEAKLLIGVLKAQMETTLKVVKQASIVAELSDPPTPTADTTGGEGS